MTGQMYYVHDIIHPYYENIILGDICMNVKKSKKIIIIIGLLLIGLINNCVRTSAFEFDEILYKINSYNNSKQSQADREEHG